ncbi:MAG: TlpA family protein disulfide reductase [Gammaproteobacteria bacterium]|nr:TlpA family protein disulfide reductase [Gammaproteobacteria bacterium]
MAVKSSRLIAGALVFLVGAVGGNVFYKWAQNNSEANVVAQQMVSKPRPEFSLPDVEGQTRNISEWDGKVTVVNFWATWCPPCRKEIPVLIELQETYENQGLQIIGVAIDSKEKVQDFMDTMGIEYPSLIGENNAIEISKNYGNRYSALPFTAIINRQGEITFTHRGELTREHVEEIIKPLL